MHVWKFSIFLLITIIHDKFVTGQDGIKPSGAASGSSPPESTGPGTSSHPSSLSASELGPGLGTTIGPGSGPITGPGSGPNTGPGSGPITGPKSGPNTASGSGINTGPGTEPGTGPGPGLPMGGIKPFIGKGPHQGVFPPFPPLPEGCKSISGIWYNDIGSMINITQNPDGNLTGDFYTIRESDPTAHKNVKANIIGLASQISNSILFGFAVSWGENLRSTAWIGECYICNGTEVLETNWISRESVEECNDKWHANRIGHSSFTKEPQPHLGPEDIAKNDFPPIPPAPVNTDNSFNCTVSSLWYNELGAKMDLEERNKNIIGSYVLPEFVRMSGNAKVVGTMPYKPQGTAAFVSLNDNGKVATLWAGQCSLCGVIKQQILDTFVANRLWVPSCLEEFRTTAYGGNKFTKTNMAPPIPVMKPNPDQEYPLNQAHGPDAKPVMPNEGLGVPVMKPNPDQEFPLNQAHGPDAKPVVPNEGLGDIQESKYDTTNTSTTTIKPE